MASGNCPNCGWDLDNSPYSEDGKERCSVCDELTDVDYLNDSGVCLLCSNS